MIKKFLNKSRIATIGGYVSSIFNAAMLIDWDILDWTSINTWIKIIGALLGPILMGHVSEIKTKQNA